MISRAHALFAEALELPPPQRGVWLLAQCTGDATLHAQVQRLLEADSDGSVLDHDVAGLASGLVVEGSGLASAAVPAVGARFGPYRILAPLGRGGMGTVWLAERSDGAYAQQVAIKLLSAPLADAEALERFAQERQILARLKHPHIARVLDGGTVDGLPWFAMDRVEGLPLDAWLHQQAPSHETVLQLMAKVAAAVQFAHQNLIVHRDLKPTNILVDAHGEPRLLDFGIAKLLDGNSELTRSRAPLSLPYAAPEQLLGEAVTTATDVYSLGVILYEALSGVRPFAVAGQGLAAWVQAITDREPPPPSRQARESVRRRQLRGDPDLVVLKCLARDPARRYGSAQALQDDLLALIARQPVRARAAGWRYRSTRFVRRHPLGVALGSIALLSVLALSLLSVQQARQARSERVQAVAEAERATAVQTFLIQLFEQQRPDEIRGAELSARDLLDRAEVQLRRGDGLTATSREALLATLGTLRYDLGHYAEALRLNEQAVALARELHGDHAYPLGRALVDRSWSLQQLGRHAEAVADCEQASPLLFNAKPSMPEQIVALLECSAVLRVAGLLEPTEQWLQRTAALAEQLDPPSPKSISIVLRHQARLAQARHNHPLAIALGTRLIDGLRADPDTSASDLATALHNRAVSERRMGLLDRAIADYREALASHRQTFGPNHELPIQTTMQLAVALDEQGSLSEAEQLSTEALHRTRADLPADHVARPALLSAAAQLAARRNQPAQAAALLDEAIAQNASQSAPSHAWQLTLNWQRAELHRLQGEFDAARANAEQVLAGLSPEPAQGWHARQAHAQLAALAGAMGDARTQQSEARWCLAALAAGTADATERPAALAQLVRAQVALGDTAAALATATELETVARAQLQVGSTARAEALAIVALAALQSGDPERSLQLIDEVAPGLASTPLPPLDRSNQALLAWLRSKALVRSGRQSEADVLTAALTRRRASGGPDEQWFWRMP